jgi:FixJ family two-component response regulator
MQQNVIVHIVDDDAAVRHSLEMLMRSVDLKTKSYASAQAFLDVFDATTPGCLVVDIRMPDMSGLDLLQELKQRRVEMPIIVITGHGDVPLTVRAMNEGAMTVLEKPYREQTLLDNIFKAVNSGMEAANRNQSRAVYLARIGTLSPREQEVMELLIAGKNSKEIATELNISFKTVDVHRAHIMEKMQVRSIIELVHLFHRFGPEILVQARP